VEAPVRGSIVLAGILLKLGGYGLIRLGYIFRVVNPVLIFMVLSLLGGGLLAIVCCGVRDLKVIIAYSSVVHIAFIIVGIMSTIIWGVMGAVIIIIAHGLCSSGMFSNANILYERRHSRSLMSNKGALRFYPRISFLWFLLCMANFGGPFTFNLLAEIILIINLARVNTVLLVSVVLVSLFSAAYSLILYSRTQQGTPSHFYYSCSNTTLRERCVLIFHLIPLLLIAMSPILV
jgi:NADH-ubiquinone oxidoreductase chain 4